MLTQAQSVQTKESENSICRNASEKRANKSLLQTNLELHASLQRVAADRCTLAISN